MNIETERMTAELAAELSADNVRRLVDPRSIPWRFHHLREMGRSAAHCLYSMQSDRDVGSLSIRLGAGCHAMLFGTPVVLWEGKVRRGAAWDAFDAAHADSLILNRNEWNKATAMSEAIRRHEHASALLFAPSVVHEKTIEWEQNGRRRRSTPDARGPRHLVELKSTRCAEPDRFARDARFMGYHAQLADQSAAIEYETGSKPEQVFIVSVENTPPYVVQVQRLTQRALEQGERLCRLWFEALCVAADANQWPGYSQSIADLDIPDEDGTELVFGESDSTEEEQPF